MAEGIVGAVKAVTDYLTGTTPAALSIPDSVGDPEAIHAVQKHYADTGFDCDEETANSIVDQAR